jgi:hypothetical protein
MLKTKEDFMKKTSLILVLTLIFTGCAKKSADIQASHVPAIEYSDKSCKQLRSEVLEINRELRVIAGVQDDTASKDQIAMGVGLVIFWPALFFLANGSDKKVEIAELKGRYKTVELVAKRKKCRFVKDMK